MSQGAGLDEGIENLERLNALLAQTSTQLEEDAGSLQEAEETLGRLDDDTEDRWQALTGQLAEVKAGLEEAAGEAGQAVSAVGELAQTASESRLSTAADSIEGLGDSIEDGLSDLGEALEAGSADLRQDGFDPAEADVAALGVDLAQSEGQVQAGLESLDGELSTGREEIPSVGSEVQEAASSFATEAQAQQSDLHLEELSGYLSDGLVPDLEAAVTAIVSTVGETYSTLSGDVDESGDQFGSDLSDSLDEQVKYLEQEASPELEQALEDAAGNALESWLADLSETETSLSAGVEVTDAAARLVPELVAAKLVVADIDRLLDNLSQA
jgi:chromosome segregation ATPase